MDVGEWLRSLGFAQYEAVFRESEIDADVLPELNDQHLNNLGISLGHRLKILRAIRELAAGNPAPNAPETKRPELSAVASEHAAERRQLTVMFCDVVGSTAMSGRLDPEDMRGILDVYHRCCATLIESNGGFVAKYMGDGVLAYFGYPVAHEHDAERAVRAALAIVEAAPRLDTAAGAPLQVRVGIATGIVVVGDLLGSGEAQERSVVGDTPNLAARLQGVAHPGGVVIAEGTRNLLGALFALRDLGPQDLKGVAGSMRAFAALRENPQESRFEALHSGRLTELVGREEESELLLRRWSKAKRGEGQVVLLSGEAGIGKSRLTAAFLERLAGETHTRTRYFCSPQHTDSALFPVIGHMERAAGLRREDDAKAKLDKLSALLAETSTSPEDAAILAEMLSLPNDGRFPMVELAPQRRRQKMLGALVTQIEVLARQNPVLMIFEDAHWADPTTVEVLGWLMERIQTLPVLLLVTFRPEFSPPRVGRPHVTMLTINRLAQREVITLIDRVVGNKALPPYIRRDIVERADGIPLFVEEMTKAVLEVGSGESATRAVAAIPSPALAVPSSLHASLMARLDRLGRAKEVAQIGAALGREFSHSLLALVARASKFELETALDRLVLAGLLFRQGTPPEATYLFNHALVQDAAYGTLLRAHRRALHGRIAEALETDFPEIAESRPAVLAHHCTEAGLIEKAARLWGKAGLQSLARSALVEAEVQLARALAQLAPLIGTTVLRREQIAFQVGLVNAQMQTKGFAAQETRASLEQARIFIERAEQLGEPAEDPLALYEFMQGAFLASIAAFKGDVARDLAAQVLALAEKQRTTIPLMIGHRLVGMSSALLGELVEARLHLDRAITLYSPVEHRSLAGRFGTDSRVTSLSYRAMVVWKLGYPTAARADADKSLASARELGHAAPLMLALNIAPQVNMFCGNYAVASAQANEVAALAEEKGAPYWKAIALLVQGCILALSGDASKAVHSFGSALPVLRAMGATLSISHFVAHLALAHARLGNFDEASACINEAIATAETSGEGIHAANICWMAGEIALMLPKRAEVQAETYFVRALAIARNQQARSSELRATMSMARLRRDQGKRQQAHELLAPVYGWFIEGFDTQDLKEAKALLSELA